MTQYVTDGGLETDLIFHHGVELPEFASFPLVEDERGRELLTRYYDGYAAVAAKAGAGRCSRPRPGGRTPTGRPRSGTTRQRSTA